jgi:hypothetical protein
METEAYMAGIELLAISLSVLFGLGMIFSILLWCRSWRKEERELADQQIKTLREAVRKLTDAIEMIDHTTASLQTADGLLTQQLEDLRSSVTRLQNVKLQTDTEPATATPTYEPAAIESPVTPANSDAPQETEVVQSGSSYDAVAGLLKDGNSTLEIARKLDIGVAEVRMIARMHASNHPKEPPKELIERG